VKESGKMMPNRGIYAKVKEFRRNPHPSGEKMLAIFLIRNPGSFMFQSFAKRSQAKERIQAFPFTTPSRELTLLM
jgi:hypothetical protein